MREPRSTTITRATLTALRSSGMTMGQFATDVVTHYHTTVALHERTFEFSTGGDPFKAARANSQILSRLMNGQVRMPVDIEESWVLSLPQPWRGELLSELAHRYGLLAAPEPVTDGVGQQRAAGDLMRETGEALIAVAGLLEDGVIDHRDQPRAHAALRELDDVIGSAVSLKATIERSTRGPSDPTPIRRAG
ncbi:MAG: hypothetical protein KDI48_02145 [Xanthomonadales bacterium]|nr:hypothetical protein [Xanthomonadales bacterium]